MKWTNSKIDFLKKAGAPNKKKFKLIALGAIALITYSAFRDDDSQNLQFIGVDDNKIIDKGDDWYKYVDYESNQSCIIGDNLAQKMSDANKFSYWNMNEFINYRNLTLPHPLFGINMNYTVYDSLCDERDALYLPNANKTQILDYLKYGNFTYSFGMELMENKEFLVGGFRFFPYENKNAIIGMNITNGVVFSFNAYGKLLGELTLQTDGVIKTINSTISDMQNQSNFVREINLFVKPGFLNITLYNELVGRLNINNLAIGEEFPASSLYEEALLLKKEYFDINYYLRKLDEED